ncbi:hypothetical protein Bealeia1_01883 [Candidatus Bealeia paramacronuclearis]|uniref:Uncharacterized protein n=1 Tax=Candidatus Bealeia paramacronuclearis TaxID=1921001 RepID=A0ABZ2C917_9PROT|nr:hypothetical protein [Candidatus Bealeia paramacronuclearis]
MRLLSDNQIKVIKKILSHPLPKLSIIPAVLLSLYLFFFPSPAQQLQTRDAMKTELSKKLSDVTNQISDLVNTCTDLHSLEHFTSKEDINSELINKAHEVDSSVNKALTLRSDYFKLSQTTNDKIKGFIIWVDDVTDYVERNDSCPQQLKSQSEILNWSTNILAAIKSD